MENSALKLAAKAEINSKKSKDHNTVIGIHTDKSLKGSVNLNQDLSTHNYVEYKEKYLSEKEENINLKLKINELEKRFNLMEYKVNAVSPKMIELIEVLQKNNIDFIKKIDPNNEITQIFYIKKDDLNKFILAVKEIAKKWEDIESRKYTSEFIL